MKPAERRWKTGLNEFRQFSGSRWPCLKTAADGRRLAVGAIGNDNINGNNAGHVRVYSWRPQGWVRLGEDIDGEAEGDNSGVSVAMSSDGTRLAVGAFYNDNINGEDAGHVRVFSGPIFSDGFESGSTSAWSSTVP